MKWITKSIGGALLCLFISGCSGYMNQPFSKQEARIETVTPATKALKNLPKPQEPIIAAVYKFRDQTGQYKPSDYGSSWSTAVTQGGTSILLKALEESGWFVPIERESLGNLLNERKIINSSREAYLGPDQMRKPENQLPPLLFAGILMEGGIISYETNIRTGGAGVRYLGIGASTQYREDRISVYLRASSTQNGRILKTVNVSKTILSQKIDASLFKYVAVDEIVEAETGFTYNEPTHLAVREAIEKAVLSMVAEGLQSGLWQMEDPTQLTENPVLTKYLEEKERNDDTDEFGDYREPRRKIFGLGFGAGANWFQGDVNDPKVGLLNTVSLSFNTNSRWGFQFNAGIGEMKSKNDFNLQSAFIEADLLYRFLPESQVTPYLIGGFGTMTSYEGNMYPPKLSEDFYPHVTGGVGLEFMLSRKFSINTLLNSRWVLDDAFDGYDVGDYYDHFFSFEFGLHWYFSTKKRKPEIKITDK